MRKFALKQIYQFPSAYLKENARFISMFGELFRSIYQLFEKGMDCRTSVILTVRSNHQCSIEKGGLTEKHLSQSVFFNKFVDLGLQLY